MPLIISPKTTSQVLAAFTRELNLQKSPKGKFWHGNFNDNVYTGLDGLVTVLFTGYSGGVVGQAMIEYTSNYLKEDQKPEAYFIGSVFAFRDSALNVGDIAYATDTFSPDSFEQSIYTNAEARNIQNITLPDPALLTKLQGVAQKQGVKIAPSKVYCCITPGFAPQFTHPRQLMNTMWHAQSLAALDENSFDSGEYESASFLACSRLFGIPAVALLDVKDKRYSLSDYRLASTAQKDQALTAMLGIVRGCILQ